MQICETWNPWDVRWSMPLNVGITSSWEFTIHHSLLSTHKIYAITAAYCYIATRRSLPQATSASWWILFWICLDEIQGGRRNRIFIFFSISFICFASSKLKFSFISDKSLTAFCGRANNFFEERKSAQTFGIGVK